MVEGPWFAIHLRVHFERLVDIHFLFQAAHDYMARQDSTTALSIAFFPLVEYAIPISGRAIFAAKAFLQEFASTAR